MQFKPGDVVVLKSGGSMMTVEAVQLPKVWCVWFENGEVKRETFLADVLQKQ